jgi:hypothetical protein
MALTGAALVWVALLAQAGGATADRPGGGWFAAAGHESQSFRDISRGGPPVDASPVEWKGSGPSLALGYERRGVRRFHRFSADIAAARSFSYVGPVRREAAPPGDDLLRVEGRYEYRRYPLDDLFVRGLDAGVGVQGIGRRLSYSRSRDAVVHEGTDLTAAIACVAAARLHRWSRWSAEIEWVNGISAVRARKSVAGETLADARRWGGGWLTDLSARLTVPIARRTALTLSYLRTGEGTMVLHNSYATSRHRVAVGVTHGR